MAKVIEWQEYGEDVLFWKWSENEIRRGFHLVIRPGQDAILMYNGKIEGIFEDEGSFDIESQIVPLLKSLSGFKFGLGSSVLRADVLFINTKELTVKWGTKNAINIPSDALSGGLPIRSFGTFSCKVDDYQTLIDKIAGVQQQFGIDDVKERVIGKLDQLLMKWIAQEGKDLFHLQTKAEAISRGIREDLDYEMRRIGIAIRDFVISSFTYPENVQKMAEAQATLSMMQIQSGAAAAQQSPDSTASAAGGAAQQTAPGVMPNFCPNCGTKTAGTRYCPNCGTRLA